MTVRHHHGHFDNPAVTIVVDTNETSDYMQFSLDKGQAVILDASAVGAIVGQLTEWLTARARAT